MKSKNKIVKRTTAVFGLAAVPAAAALGLSYGLKDDKINLSLSPAHDYGERYFDNKIVKVNDDDFASDILYNPLKREEINYASKDAMGKEIQNTITEKQEKSADIAGLVRLDRKLDINYAHDVIEVKTGDTNQGSIDVDGGLKYPFHDIHEIINLDGGKHLYGKDIIKGMEEDAKIAITKTILDFKEKRKLDGIQTKTLNLGIYFDKNVIDRTVSIYLYELKGFDDEQQDVIDNFVNNVESKTVDETDVNKWLKHFSYNVDYSASDDRYGIPKATQSYDRIDGKSENIDVDEDGKKDNGTTGFPEFFGGDNIMGINEMNNWYRFGGIEDKDEYDLSLTEDGKIAFRDTTGGVMTTKAEFDQRHPNGFQIYKKANGVNKGGKSVLIHWSDIESRIKNSKYINFGASLKTNPIINNVDVTDKSSHILGPVQFVEKGIVPIIEPSVDFKNHVLKVKYTFKAFRKQGQDSSRSVGSFTMGEDVSNPYEISTYVKEIPLDNMGKVQKSDGTWETSKLDGSRTFEDFYEDSSTNIDETKPGYDKLKASVIKAFKNEDQSSWNRSGAGGTNPSVKPQAIDRTAAKVVLKEFLTKKTPEYAAIPIVGPGLGILGQMIPSIATSVQQWMNIGNMVAADATIADEIFTDGFMENLINKLEADPTINTPALINGLNSFTKEAWSDLNSLIGLSGKTINGERYARTFLLYQLLAAITDINEPIMKEIKDRFPNVYIGSHTSVLDQLMSWLKKNGIISSEDSLMDIVNNYRTRLGTIVETLGINRPTMQSDLIQQLVNLIPLPLFSTKDGRFNVDTSAVLDALINGKYIMPGSDEKNAERTLPAIINLLNGGARTSVQTFFEHILNDKSADLFKYILGVIGADFAETDTFENAIKAVCTVFEAKVPDYNFDADGKILMVEQKDTDGNAVVDKTGTPVKIPSINKDADGQNKMIINPTFGGIGIALESMFNDGIHSVPKESYDSIIKFIFGPVSSFVKMSTLTQEEFDKASKGFYDFITNGAGTHTLADGTMTQASSDDIRAIINTVNAIANKHLISPDLSNLIVALMKNGLGQNAVKQGQALSVADIKPLAGMLMPIISKAITFDPSMTADSFALILSHLFNGFPDADTLVNDLSTLIPAIKDIDIPVVGKVTDLLKVIFNDNYPNMFKNIALSLAQPNLEPLQKVFTKGLGNLEDSEWEAIVKGVRSILSLAGSFIKGPTGEMLDTLFGSEKSADAFIGIGHLISKGLGQVGTNDIVTAFEMINKLKLSFSIPNGLDDKGMTDGSVDLVHPLASLISNVMQNGIELSTLDIDTIMKLVDTYGGSKFADIINTINKANPEQQQGEKAPKYDANAFKNLLIDFVVGHKYVGHEGDYAKDKISEIKLPPEVSLLPGVGMPGKMMTVNVHHATGGDTTEQVENPAWWDQNKYNRLIGDFHTLVAEVSSGYLDYKNSGDHGRKLTSTELFNKLIEAQMIPNQLAAIQSKIRAANAKVQIWYDALDSFAGSHDEITKIGAKNMLPSVTGDAKDWFKSIRDLFDVMKTNILKASSVKPKDPASKDPYEWSFEQMVKSGTSPETIAEKEGIYDGAINYLNKLNGLLDKLNTGNQGTDFLDDMKSIFGEINSKYGNEGIKGILPGLPPALKVMLDNFLKSNTVGADTPRKAAWVDHVDTGKKTFFFGKPIFKDVPNPAVEGPAFSAFKKFISDNWEGLFGNSGLIGNSNTGWEIIPHFGSDWHNPLKSIPSSIDTMAKLSDAMYSYIKSPAEQKLFKQLADEFKKHIS